MMGRVVKKILFVSLFLITYSAIGQSLLTPVTITSEKSAHINSGVDVNYDISTLDVGTYLRLGVQTYRRAFVEFDIAAENIPTGAIIYSATLDITHNGTVYGSNPWKAKLVKTSWGETAVKASNQPAISGLSGDISSTYTTSGNTVKIDVTSMVQRMNYEQISNYGWSIQVNNEGYSGRTGAVFYSDDHGTPSLRPKLVIKYYIPLSITAATIVHESATSAADGSISFSYTNGGSTNYLYSWYDGAGNPLTGGASLSNLEAGWYGVKMVGDDGIVETFYYAFLVGTECKEVTIEFDPDANYMDNAMNTNLVLGGVDYGDYNYGNQSTLTTYYKHTTGQKLNSFLKMKLWVDDALTLNQADLTLQGQSHSGSSNVSEFDLVNGAWNETLISWNNSPITLSSTTVAIPQTYSTTEDKVIDMTDFWNLWKANNATNYGVVFQMLPTSSDNQQYYHSPTATTPADRPVVEFKVGLYYEDTPHRCSPVYAVMKRDLSGVRYQSVDDLLYFAFENEYASASSNLDYQIYYTDMLAPAMEGTTSLVSLGFGVNQRILNVGALVSGTAYVLVATNDKGEKSYLRFVKD